MIEITDTRDASSQWRGAGLISKFRQLALVGATLLAASAADAKVIYVNGNKTSSGNGATWQQSIRYLQDALDIAVPGDSVWLAKGTYFPDDGVPNGYGDRELSFEIDRVNLYGGFAGNETNFNQRNIKANKTILSGEIWELDLNDPEKIGNDRYWSLHVLIVNGTSRLDGLTIQNGRASGEAAPYNRGGGILVAANQSVRLASCVVFNNLAAQSGGGVWGKVVATNTQFIDNKVTNEYNFNSNPNRIQAWLFSPNCSGGAIEGETKATRCKFINNSVHVRDLEIGDICSATGGAINGSQVTLTDCDFDENSISAQADHSATTTSRATARGGSVSGTTTATRCTFSNGTVYTYADSAISPANAIVPHISYPSSLGGAIAGKSTIVNCVFSGISMVAEAGSGDATNNYNTGAALYLEGASTVTNSAFVGNSCESINGTLNRGGWVFAKGAVMAASGSTLPISNCTFLNNASSGNGAALAVEGSCNLISNVFWQDGTVPGSDLMIHVGERPDNTAGGRGRISNRLYPTPSTETINLVAGGFASVTRGTNSNVDFGEPAERTFIPLDPQFLDIANPAGLDGKWMTGDDGLRLTSGSPAIGKGLKLFLARDTADLDGDGNTGEAIPSDLASYVRVQGGSLDLGAYEFGTRINSPDIAVEYPSGTTLVDNQNTIDFSNVVAQPQTFVIRNTGLLFLNGLSVTGNGADINDFKITQPNLKGLSTNAVTTFTVTFRPGANVARSASLQVRSNDPDEDPFDILLTGTSEVPDIAVEYPVGTDLTSGTSIVDYGTIASTSSATSTFTIRNTGLGNLAIDSIKSSGGNAASFIPSAPAVNFLAPGDSTTFTVRFDGSAGDALASTIIVGNSDPDAESSFKIKVKGFGKRAPEIDVSQPFSAEISDGDTVNYGNVAKRSSYTKTFVIKNTGNADLRNIKVKLSGSKTFSLDKTKTKTLKPGSSTNFKVTFNPTSKGKKSATLKVLSNDSDEGKIVIALKGKGVKKSSNNPASNPAAAFAGAASSSSASGSAGSVTVVSGQDGQKYQMLTVKKTAGESPGTVEVSSDLVEWFSGSRHTTTLVDSASVLKVRDNTPIQNGEKRYIRLK